MDEIRIITNNVPRHVLEAYELTAAERAEFDYIDWAAVDNGESSPEFIRYKGELYDLGDFMTTHDMPEDDPLRAWSGYASDSFFSGVLVRWVFEGEAYAEQVVMGRYLA